MEEAIAILKTLVRYLKLELEDPQRMNGEIIDGLSVILDEKESFYKNHKIDIKPEEAIETDNQKESEETQAERPANDQETSENVPQDVTVENLDKDSNEADHGNSDDEENIKDLPRIREEKPPEDKQMEEVNLNVEDDGNNADTEGWGAQEDPNQRDEGLYGPGWVDEDQTKYFAGEGDIGGSETFKPNEQYEYGFDDELQCMVYTGPDFQVGDFVDAMKIEPDITDTIQCWEQAQIYQEDEY